jgi:hypothetical protein
MGIDWLGLYRTTMTDLSTVNGFTFCAVHGGEWCHLCTVDYRMGNNAWIEDEIAGDLEGLDAYSIDVRI